jgi:hypothetical protein
MSPHHRRGLDRNSQHSTQGSPLSTAPLLWLMAFTSLYHVLPLVRESGLSLAGSVRAEAVELFPPFTTLYPRCDPPRASAEGGIAEWLCQWLKANS